MDFPIFQHVMGSKKSSKLDILKIKDLKTTNRDSKKANKQDIRYYSIDSNRQDSYHYNHLSYKSLF